MKFISTMTGLFVNFGLFVTQQGLFKYVYLLCYGVLMVVIKSINAHCFRLLRMKSVNGRLTRLSSPYHFRVEYRSGTDNGNADGLL